MVKKNKINKKVNKSKIDIKVYKNWKKMEKKGKKKVCSFCHLKIKKIPW